MNLVKNYNISLIYDINDSKLFNVIKSIHGRIITFDCLGKYIYDGERKIKCYGPNDDFSKFVFSDNIIDIIKKFGLERHLKEQNQYTMPFAETGFSSSIKTEKKDICEQFEGKSNQNIYELQRIVNSNCKNDIIVKINDKLVNKTTKYNMVEIDNYDIVGYHIIFNTDHIKIKDGDIISLYRPNDCIYSTISLICDYKITKDDEYNYYYNKKQLEIDISKCRKVDMQTIQCTSYNGLMNQTIDFIVDEDKKIIKFKIEPNRDRYIQIYGMVI
jgi:hypothetical protein